MNNFRDFLTAYHITNVILSASFVLSKSIGPLSLLLYGPKNTGLDSREHEILIFLAVVLVWKGKKAANLQHFLSTLYLCAKFVNAFLFFRASPFYGICYSVPALASMVLLSETLHTDSRKIKHFEGNELRTTLEEDKSTIWVILFYTKWNAHCRYVAPVFSALSERYTLPNLKFGKLDIGVDAKDGEHFRINTHVSSRQIPSIALFRNGVQSDRRPAVSNGRALPFIFSEVNCANAFNLNNLHEECKSRPRKIEKNSQKPHSE